MGRAIIFTNSDANDYDAIVLDYDFAEIERIKDVIKSKHNSLIKKLIEKL